jgi:hypothetical protein
LSALVVSHAMHASPPTPQAASERALQVGPEQHPLVHVVAHPLHTPLVHVSTPGQAWHSAPPLPHSPGTSPERQSVPAQQPMGHERPSQTHFAFRQCCPAAHAAPVPHWHAPVAEQLSAVTGLHATHAVPLPPHAVTEGGVHVAPEQHAEGHDVASQTQAPAEHLWPGPHGGPTPHSQAPAEVHVSATAAQLMHVEPLEPHDASERV